MGFGVRVGYRWEKKGWRGKESKKKGAKWDLGFRDLRELAVLRDSLGSVTDLQGEVSPVTSPLSLALLPSPGSALKNQ